MLTTEIDTLHDTHLAFADPAAGSADSLLVSRVGLLKAKRSPFAIE